MFTYLVWFVTSFDLILVQFVKKDDDTESVGCLHFVNKHMAMTSRFPRTISKKFIMRGLYVGVPTSCAKYLPNLLNPKDCNCHQWNYLHCTVQRIIYQELLEPNWLVPGDHSSQVHAQLDPNRALNLLCNWPLVSDRQQAGTLTFDMWGHIDNNISYLWAT